MNVTKLYTRTNSSLVQFPSRRQSGSLMTDWASPFQTAPIGGLKTAHLG
jgi:hypothetical protein